MANNSINFQINYQKGDTSALDSLKKELQELKALASNLDMGFDPGEINQLLSATTALDRALTGAFDVKLNTINIQKFNQLLAQSGMNAQKLREGLAVAGAAGDQAFFHATAQLMQFNTATKQTSKFLNSIASSFFNTVKYTVFNTILNNISGTVQRAAGYVKELDTSLNDIRIVTGKSADEMQRFAESANKAAKQLAVTTSDYTEGSLIYYQQGLDDNTVKTLTDITAMTSNVTGQSMETVSEQLTAVWNGYRVANQAAKEGMQVYEEYVDKMAAVGAATASDLEELSVAMSKVASAASSMGVSFDDLNAQIATIVSVTRQAPESVGTALKTIYARLGDLSVDGVDEFGVSLGKVTEQMQVMGIQILDQNGNMRDMTSVMAEVADKWNTWTEAQRQAAAIAMAGKRQYNNLVALFDNWDMYGKALETSMGAAGTLEEQQEIALDSLANKMDILRTTAEDLYDSLIDEDTLKTGIEGLTKIVQLMADFADATGGLNTLLPILGATLTRVFSQQISQGLSAIISNFRIDASKAAVDKQNEAALHAMFSDSGLFQSSANGVREQARIEGLNQLKTVYNELAQYQSIMTKDEQDQYNYIVKMAEKAASLGAELAEQKDVWTTLKNSSHLIEQDLINDVTNTEKLSKLSKDITNIKSTAQALNEAATTKRETNRKGKIDSELDKTIRAAITGNGLSADQSAALIQKYEKMEGSLAVRAKTIAQELSDLGIATEKIVKLGSEAERTSEHVSTLSNTLFSGLDLKATIMSITNTVGALGQLASAITTVTNIFSIIDNEDLDTSQKILQIVTNLGFALPMIISSVQALNKEIGYGNIIIGIWESLTKRAAIAEEAEAVATGQATKAQLGFNAALAANPIGAILTALTVLFAAYTIFEKHQEKVIENAKKQAEASQEEAKKLKEEANAHKELISSYNEVLDKYKQGAATKEELYEATDKLIEAYDLEEARLDVLLGKYGSVTEAIKAKRDAELDAQKNANKEALNDTTKSILINAEKNKNIGRYTSVEDQSKYTRFEIGFNSDIFDFDSEEAYAKVLNKQKEIFGDQLEEDGEGTGNYIYKVDESDQGALLDFYQKSLQYRRWLKEEGYEDYEIQKRIAGIASELNKDGGIDNLNELRNSQKEIVLEEANLDDISSEAEFSSAIDNIKSQLSNLYSDEEIDNIVMSAIAHTNTALAQQFYIDEAVTKKFGDNINETLKQAFHNYDPNIQKAIIELGYDFSDEDSLRAFATLAQAQVGSSYKVSANLQHQVNETVMNGKDINKSDWESYTENLPAEALQLLGEREEFNNKPVQDRIDLLKQVNELIKEQNNLAVQQGLIHNEAIESITKENELREQQLKATLQSYETALKYGSLDEQSKKNIKENIKEIEEELKNLENLSQEIDIGKSITNQINSALNDIMTDADKMRVAAESIGAGWKVAAEDVGAFVAAFPELREKATILDNGDLQLDKEITNQYLENIQARIQANKEEAKAAAETQLQKVQLEKKYYEKQLNLVNEAIKGNKTAEELKQDMAQETSDYVHGLQKAGLIGEVEALNTAQDNLDIASKGMKGSFENINEYIKTVNTNFAQMFSENPNWQGLTEVSEGVKKLSYEEFTGYEDKVAELRKKGFETDEDIQALFNQRDAYEQAIKDASELEEQLQTSISLTSASLEKASKAADRVKKGLAGKEDKSKSSGKDKDKELKKLEEEFDRYWEIHKALDQIDRDMKKLDKDQQNLHGYELIRSLKQENQLLANQAQLYEQMAAAQAQEAEELRGKLSNSGVIFDASGAVINYAQATAAALEAYNKAIQQYNAGLLDDAAFKIHEKAFEEFKKNLERYDTLFYTEMKETQDKLDDIRRQTLANNLKAWEVEIQVKLDFKDLERQWNDFLTEVSEDFKKVFKDIKVEMRSMLVDAQSYIGGEGTINTILEAIRTVTGEIDKMMGGGTSDMFESVSQAQEKLKELNSQLLESGKALHDLWVKAWQAYLDGIDQAADKFDDLMDRFDRINNELEFQGKLIKLLYGEEAYSLMSKLYEGQEKNTKAQMESLKKQTDMWKKMFDDSGATMDNQSDWTEDQKKYYEQWMEAQDKLNDKVLDYIQLLKDDYLNTVEATLKELETAITGSSLKDIQEEWEDISAEADKYYDSVEGAYHIQTLANKIDQSITETNNLQAQQKLMKLKEKEIAYLREKENLTEYDLKAAEARYQIALKEIALQESQQNKTSMKLTRNEQGNWSYQYVADEIDVANKQQDLLDAYNNLYQLASDAYTKNLESLQQLHEKYLEKARQIAEDETLTEEEKQIKLDALRETYLKNYERLSEENSLYRDDLAKSSAALLLEIYEQDQDAYESMTEKERELVDTLINANIEDYSDLEDKLTENYKGIGIIAKEVMTETRRDWTSGAQQIADLWNKDNGSSVKVQVTNAYNKIQKANEDYQKKVDECAEIVERDFGEAGITGAIERAEEETDNLKDKTQDLVDESVPYLRRLKEYVDEIGDAWKSVQDEIKDAISLIEEYLRKIGEANNAGGQNGGIGGGGSGGGTGGGNGSIGGKNPGSGEGAVLQNNTVVTPTADGWWSERLDYSDGTSEIRRTQHSFREYIGRLKGTFKTGGYTGTWNNGDSQGRFGLLHQKELVLNADDTKNFLSGINMIRSMITSNGSIEQAVLRAAANMAYSLGNFSIGSVPSATNHNSTTDNVFNITAEFPNANSVDEIREAILSLPNIASQFVNSNTR